MLSRREMLCAGRALADIGPAGNEPDVSAAMIDFIRPI
jgi:hypothetical protein